MNGNQAIAMGALSAGLKFCSFYPMTPATSIVLNLAAQAGRMGLVVEQAEDEIAAINMAIGASFAGAPSMTATSGGGFALMTEAVSLAGMSETPVLIVVAQRPGPATGLPTRTEQADLELVFSRADHLKWRPSFRPLSFSSLTSFSPTPHVLLHPSILTTWSRLIRR
jgi:2-oxoglutarate ferredoxin oxidoreductase subunit alpha